MANFVASYLKGAGSFVEISEFAEGRANVIAKLKGRESGNAVMLNGHLDTVPFGNLEGWETPLDISNR